MPLWTDRILPRLVHSALRSREIGEVRSRYLGGVGGIVLEIGFGSGLNLPYLSGPHLPGKIERLYAVEPSETAWELAREAVERAPFLVERTGQTAESIPLPDASVDHAISAFTLCTIPGVRQAMGEVRRVLRPGGTFRFVEHGRSPEPRVARWQDRLTPIQKRVAGGCHLNRDIEELIRNAGFRIERLDRFHVKGPKVATHVYAGTAAR